MVFPADFSSRTAVVFHDIIDRPDSINKLFSEEKKFFIAIVSKSSEEILAINKTLITIYRNLEVFHYLRQFPWTLFPSDQMSESHWQSQF